MNFAELLAERLDALRADGCTCTWVLQTGLTYTPDLTCPVHFGQALTRSAVAQVLADHRYQAVNASRRTGCRGCTWTYPLQQTEHGRLAHEDHVAEQVLAAVSDETPQARNTPESRRHDRAATLYPNLATAVGEELDKPAEREPYTDGQWAAIEQLHTAFGLEVADTAAIALVAGRPLLAVVRTSPTYRDARGHHVADTTVIVVRTDAPGVSEGTVRRNDQVRSSTHLDGAPGGGVAPGSAPETRTSGTREGAVDTPRPPVSGPLDGPCR